MHCYMKSIFLLNNNPSFVIKHVVRLMMMSFMSTLTTEITILLTYQNLFYLRKIEFGSASNVDWYSNSKAFFHEKTFIRKDTFLGKVRFFEKLFPHSFCRLFVLLHISIYRYGSNECSPHNTSTKTSAQDFIKDQPQAKV